MNIALLGYGKEMKAVQNHFKNATFDIFDHETPEEFQQRDYSSYDIIFRSPSIPPLGVAHETTVTRYFFDHCPCPIIGVTATKGKGTTCSFIKSLLDAESYDVHLVGNIGVPAIEVLPKLTPTSVVVYEMSSFQLWDLEKSPTVSVIGHIEPDHLNVHKDYSDYLSAKGNIARYQSASDYCIYYSKNPESVKLMELSPAAHKIPYPFSVPEDILSAITLPGRHNEENAIAAIAAVASLQNISPDEYLAKSPEAIKRGLSSFHGLPHRLEFVRELHGVKFYDDNFATTASALRVAIEAFPDERIVVIAGGRDKTAGQDLDEIWEILQAPQITERVFIGESGWELVRRSNYEFPTDFYEETLEDAVHRAYGLASSYYSNPPIVLMSPAAASFDMFKDVYDRGAKYQKLVKSLT